MNRSTLARLVRPFAIALLLAAALLLGAGTSAWATPSQSPAGQTVPTATPGAPIVPPVTPPPVYVPGGTEQVVTPGVPATVGAGDVAVVLPANALSVPGTLVLLPQPADKQPLNGGVFVLLGKTIEIMFYDAQGNPVEHPTFANPIQICFDYSADDLSKADGKTDNLVVQFYDTGAQKWVPLPSSADVATGRACGAASHLTLFGLTARTKTPGALPRTGGLNDPAALPHTGEPADDLAPAWMLWVLSLAVVAAGMLILAYQSRRRVRR